jgi:ABC-type uncharacterized transport system substrate-binding protein
MQAGVIANKIISGTEPKSIPVETPSSTKIVVNKRVADTIGLPIPTTIKDIEIYK